MSKERADRMVDDGYDEAAVTFDLSQHKKPTPEEIAAIANMKPGEKLTPKEKKQRTK